MRQYASLLLHHVYLYRVGCYIFIPATLHLWAKSCFSHFFSKKAGFAFKLSFSRGEDESVRFQRFRLQNQKIHAFRAKDVRSLLLLLKMVKDKNNKPLGILAIKFRQNSEGLLSSNYCSNSSLTFSIAALICSSSVSCLIRRCRDIVLPCVKSYTMACSSR